MPFSKSDFCFSLQVKTPHQNQPPAIEPSRWKCSAVCEVQPPANGAKKQLLPSQLVRKRLPANSLG